METPSKLCFCVLCGVPGSGKSSVSRSLYQHKDIRTPDIPEREHSYFHVEFDKIIPFFRHFEAESEDDEGSSILKEQRSQLADLVEEFVKHISLSDDSCFSKPAHISEEMYSEFLKIIPPGWNSRHKCKNVIIIDDNMYLHSMRYTFLKIARQYCAGFCEIYMDAPLCQALEMNSQRPKSEQVPENIIRKMASRLEVPGAYSWEKHVLVKTPDTKNEMNSILQLIEKALQCPEKIHILDQEERRECQLECSLNLLHQVDLILRRCVKDYMLTSKESQCSKSEMCVFSQKASSAKDSVIKEFKNNNQDVLNAVVHFAIKDAVKDCHSDLFRYLSSLFQLQINQI